MRRFGFIGAWFFVCALAGISSASAHPLGNFTINHLAKISASRQTLRVRYILDIAEIPTFQILHARNDGNWTAAMLQDWANGESSTVESGFHARIDGLAAPLQPLRADARLRPGAGGLPIIRWVGEFAIPLAAGTHHVQITDMTYADRRIGWKDIVSGSQSEPTDELQHYPSALIGTPRRVNGVSFTVEPAGTIVAIARFTDATPPSGTLAAWVSPTVLSDMFSRANQTPLFVVLTVLAAFGLGSLHGIEPGHGKALLAFTLVGARATTKQAAILAISLTFAHTAGVLLLGAVLFFAAGFVSESIYPWITLLSGVAIAIIGARALANYVHGRAHGHSHEHNMASHGERSVASAGSAVLRPAQDDVASHGERSVASAGSAVLRPAQDDNVLRGHAHHQVIPGADPLKFRSAIWAAMSGGIAPCPAAIVVLLAALRLHHLGYGLVLIVIFSLGLAAVLSGIGIGVVHGAAWLSRRSAYARFVAYGPLLSAIVISVIGSWTLAQGFTEQGVNTPAPLIAALAVAAIASYAVAQRAHSHGGRPHAHAEAPGA